MHSHNEWVRYEPETKPEGVPENAIFWRRKSDGVDWYEWSREHWNIVVGEDASGTTKVAVAAGRVIGVQVNATFLSFPAEFTLYELEDGEQVPELGWYLHDGAFYADRQGMTPDEKRAAMPNISGRQLWLMARNINVTKALVLASLDEMSDQDEAEILRIEMTEAPMNGYERMSPAVEKLRTMQNIPIEQFDDLWTWASQI